MSDKEFDKQFKDKFESFEVEPSDFIWNDIDAELEASTKKPFPWFNVAAAGMAAIVAAGIWFAPHKQHMKLYSKVKVEQQNVVLKEQPSAIVVQAYPAIETELAIAKEEKQVNAPVSLGKVKLEKEEPKAKAPEDAIIPATATAIMRDEDGVHRDQPVSITIESLSEETFSKNAVPANMLAYHSLPEDTTTDRARHKIRSVGDLVNFVVSKVDKRKNKIIEFSKDDEGEEISGLNLGVLQYRTHNN